MRSIDSSIMAQLESGELRPFGLLHMNIDSTDFYFTDCDVPIVMGGNRYEPRGIDIGNISYSLSRIVDQATLSLDNLDDYLTTEFVGGTPQGSEVVVSMVVLDSDYAVVASQAVTLFQGEIGAWNMVEGKIDITITNQFAQWNQRTLNNHSPSCRWKVFKGTECTYSGGETWCDRSYTRCVALSNQANFGGFRWLPSIENKKIWWGQVPGPDK